jgi:ribosome-associated translation inhibitor RaiA
MTKNLPAYRYELFTKAFEKRVTAAQQAIDQLRKLEAPYNLLKDAMEAERLPNEQHIIMDSGRVSVHVTATSYDSLEAFEALASRLGKRLRDAKMHRDGVPATSHGGTVCCLWFRWMCGAFMVTIFVNVPTAGMRDVAVTVRERQTIETEYVLQRIEPPSYPAPANFKNGTSTPSELARIEAELGAAEREEVAF